MGQQISRRDHGIARPRVWRSRARPAAAIPVANVAFRRASAKFRRRRAGPVGRDHETWHCGIEQRRHGGPWLPSKADSRARRCLPSPTGTPRHKPQRQRPFSSALVLCHLHAPVRGRPRPQATTPTTALACQCRRSGTASFATKGASGPKTGVNAPLNGPKALLIDGSAIALRDPASVSSKGPVNFLVRSFARFWHIRPNKPLGYITRHEQFGIDAGDGGSMQAAAMFPACHEIERCS